VSDLTVRTSTGEPAGTVSAPDGVFDVAVNVPLIHQVVVAQLAAARQGTHKVKRRGEVSGGGRKPYKQKGTGRARQGSIRAPQFAGGGVVHGPTPRDYSQRTPKKMIAAALRGALSDRARADRVVVVDELVPASGAPSTSGAVATLAAVAPQGRVLLALGRQEDVAWRSARNVTALHLLYADQLNAYDVLVSDRVVFTRAGFDLFVSKQHVGRRVVLDSHDDTHDDTHDGVGSDRTTPVDRPDAATADENEEPAA